MSSSNGSGRPSGSVPIPVEIIREPNSSTNPNSHSRHNSPYRTLPSENSFGGGYSNSPPWTSTGRFQPRHSPGPAYDRVISNSQFNQPFNDRSSFQTRQDPQFRHPNQQMYEPGPSNFSRSSEDLLNSPFDSMRYSNQPQYSSLIPPSFGGGSSAFRTDSDFVQPTKFSSPFRRSFDALNDFGDNYQSFPTSRPYQSDYQQQPYYRSTYQTQHQPQQQPQQQQQQQQQSNYANQNYTNPNIVYTNEFGVPTDHYTQGTGSNISTDRSRSPASQRGPSPARQTPPTSQQQEEPELKMAKDTEGPIPMPAPASASSSSPPTQSADQQVPSTDPSAPTHAPSPAPPEPMRDPNTIALEKLTKMKEDLDALEKEVDVFDGSTRNNRRYKFLDEQALKIMIRCDELVDVSADIKEKRKEMIRNVQRVIHKLEAKVPSTPAPGENSNPMETVLTSADSPHHEEMNENKSLPATTTEQTVAT